MKKYISIVLVFAALAGSGCRALVKNADEILKKAGKVVKEVDPPPRSTKGAAKAVTKFIKSAGKNGDRAVKAGRKAGMNYVRRQQITGSLIDKYTLEEVIITTIMEEMDKTGRQIARSEIRDAAEEIAFDILESADNDEETK